MADILPFKAPAKKKAKSKGLCQHGHHNWQVCKDKQFDVKHGKLVTIYRCKHCSVQKVTTH